MIEQTTPAQPAGETNSEQWLEEERYQSDLLQIAEGAKRVAEAYGPALRSEIGDAAIKRLTAGHYWSGLSIDEIVAAAEASCGEHTAGVSP